MLRSISLAIRLGPGGGNRARELVAIERGSDVADYCDGTSHRVLWGDLERVERCEASRGPQTIICTGEDDAGVDYSGL